MKEIIIYEFQLESIYNALRLIANTYDCRENKTCLHRMVTQAEQYAINALAGEKDKRVRYPFRPAEQDNPTASKHPIDSGIERERWPSVNTSTSEAMMNSQMSKSKEFHEVVNRHPFQDILDKENKTGKWSKAKLIAALIIDNDNLKQTVKELTAQLKQKG